MDTKTALHPIYQKQFTKFHEKVQNKYDEMLKKLEKSRSIDALTSLNGDYDYKEKKYVSVCNLSIEDLYSTEIGTKGNLLNIVSQDKHKNATFQEIITNDAFVTENDSIPNIHDKFDSDNEGDSSVDNTFNTYFFGKNDFKTSLESLNETKESDASSEAHTPTTKSIRSKINSKLKKRVKEKEFKEKEQKVKLQKKESREKVEKYVLSNTARYNIIKTNKRRKKATVTVALIEVTGLEEMVEKSRVLLFRFRLGTDKRKSKIVKSDTALVKFQELFNFHLFEDEHVLEITLWDREVLIGRNELDLSQIEKEKTHKMNIKLEGEVKDCRTLILLTVSGTTLLNTLYNDNESDKKRRKSLLQKEYAWYRFCDDFANVGFLQVIVYGAKGLSGNDCFCIVKLDYQRVQTQTDYKTNDPSWMKIFAFTVTDITSILEVIVVDEKKCEEVGRICKPLLRIRHGKKWYALKDSTLKDTAKGNNPRILLELNVAWNLIKGAVRVLNPKEPNYLETDEKLNRHVFARNLSRAKAVTKWITNTFTIYKTCFEWESMKLNIVSLIIWLTFCFYAKMWMMPLLLLIPFFWYKPKEYTLMDWKTKLMHEIAPESISADAKNEKEDKNSSLRQKFNSLQEIIQSIQNIIGKLASTGESIKNLFNFTVPFVSFLAIFCIFVIAFVMYLIPFNYICMIWAVNKFVKKIFRPNRVRNNEIMDLLSRVPDDETLIEYEDLPLAHISDDDAN